MPREDKFDKRFLVDAYISSRIIVEVFKETF